jgi:fused signal recognition particle receptor
MSTLTRSWKEKLLSVSRLGGELTKKLLGLFGAAQIDEELYEQLESILLNADVGMLATTQLLSAVRNKVSLRDLKNASQLYQVLAEEMHDMLLPLESTWQFTDKKPFVILLAGVNGAGKTTSIAKLTNFFQQHHKSVMLAAADTFRAAAVEQLVVWGQKNNVQVIHHHGEAAAICFSAIQAAQAKNIDILLIDTAGRLSTQPHLMAEIKKIKKVIAKALPNAPDEVLLILDGTIGQNAINQVSAFNEAIGITGLLLTKLDGTAKGGVIFALAAAEHKIPLLFLGVGEQVHDLIIFNAKRYVDNILQPHTNNS